MCGEPRQPKSLVQLSTTRRERKQRADEQVTVVKKQQATAPEKDTAKTRIHRERAKPIVECFHCVTCGIFLRNRAPGYAHICPGPRPIEYQTRRKAICYGGCRHNVNGVCELVRAKELAKGNDKPGLIVTGVAMPMVRCPIGAWPAVTVHCPACQRLNSDPQGPRICRYCGSDLA